MKRSVSFISLGLLLFCVSSYAISSQAAGLTAEEIVQKSAETDKVQSWSSKTTMQLLAKNSSERVRESVIYSKLKPDGHDMQRLIRFTSPADISGTNVLIHEHSGGNDDIWIYLPSMKKVRRLLTSGRKESFIGTDFSYADITTPKVHENNHALLRQESLNGVPCFVIESVPKDDDVRKGTGYSKTITWIRQDNLIRVKAELFDLSGALFKVMQVHSVKEIDRQRNKWLMEKVEMLNLQSGHTTIITFNDIRTGADISDKMFSPGRLDKE